MDKDTRSLLQRATQAARRTLEEEFAAQLEGVFDIRPDGTIAAEAGRHLAEDGEAQRVRVKLVAAVQHHREQGRRPAEAVAAVLRECAFTTLNRFVALKMLEARDIVKPCVSLGPLSGGFKEFTGLAPGLATLPDQGYRLYLDSLFDEIGREVKVLFDRRDPASLLWPRKTALDALLGILNDAALAGVWGEDETIGWVYQYFNGEDERRQMRAESQAPRNSRELAVRNQFFTPRYVVEFLTDNTLGRTWVEMRRGDTRLVESCRYLVQRPSEVFLAEGEAEPATEPMADAAPPPEGRPSYVPFRAKKDPRDLRVLDPACGSGHFLLYSFDLLLVIYEEAWADPASPASEVTGRALAADYPTRDALRRALPGLVLRHNLYGVDIDPRAAQIAALALWMRAQRAWNELGFKRADRPLVTRTNIVVAEPMPGEPDLLDGLCAGLEAPVADIVRAVFDDMKLAGEAGMLLRIEDTVRRGVEQLAKVGGLFASEDARRWERLEAKVYEALRSYAESVGGSGYRRRLFAEDAAQGFAFIDVCRQSFDVVLMNPPFGEATAQASSSISAVNPEWNYNLLCAFMSRARDLAPGRAAVGAIYDRTANLKSTYEAFRRLTLLGESSAARLVLDLGWSVLDANVEVTAAVVTAPGSSTSFLDVREIDVRTKAVAILRCGVTTRRIAGLRKLPNAVVSGDFPDYLVDLLATVPSLAEVGYRAYSGYTLKADAHNRLRWEIAEPQRTRPFFAPMFNGAGHEPYTTSMVEAAVSAVAPEDLPPNSTTIVRNSTVRGRAGLCFGKRGEHLAVHIAPPGMLFTQEGRPIPVENTEAAFALLGYLNTPLMRRTLNLYCGQHKTSGYLNLLPWRPPSAAKLVELVASTKKVVQERMLQQSRVETDPWFSSPSPGPTIRIAWNQAILEHQLAIQLTTQTEATWNEALIKAMGVPSDEVSVLAEFREAEPAPRIATPWVEATCAGFAAALVSWTVGVAFGRFDLRLATGERPLPPDPDPFSPLPPYSPGMLTGHDGLPLAAPPPGYAIAFPTDGILVDDPGAGRDLLVAVRRVFAVVFGDAGDERLAEAVTLLDPRSEDLRPWLRSPFFAEHIHRYSKSRRKAPIYWRLGTPSGSYSVWLYLHRVGPDTLHAALRDQVEPKLRYEEGRWHGLTAEAGPTPSTAQRKELAAQEAFVDELRAFRDELVRVAPLWHPDLDDGVVINASFLHRLFLHTKAWAKECEGHWEKLKAGDYDWARLAMRLWPERVVPKCAEDRSLAIAHGLEDVFWVEGDNGKWSAREVDDATVQRIVAERTSAAVKAALREVSAAPPPARAARVARPSPAAKPEKVRPASAPRPEDQLPLQLASPAPPPASSTLDALRAALHRFPEGAGKAELLAASGLKEGQWMPAINELVASGEVERVGQKRGTRYVLRPGGRT